MKSLRRFINNCAFLLTLDNLLGNDSIEHLTLAKIDIEGAELLAFRGATTLLQKQRPHVWVVELNNTVNHFSHTKQDVIDYLSYYDYHLYRYDADENQLFLIKLEQKQGNNVLAIADGHLDFVKSRLGITVLVPTVGTPEDIVNS